MTSAPFGAPRNIYLVGPTGAGKTTVGRRLAALIGWRFVDLDAEIESMSGAAIPLIFELEGEAGFRDRECAALRACAAGSDQVIATGGGAVLAPDNRLEMRRTGFVVHLEVSVDEQLRRLKRDRKRPLLATEDRAARLEAMATGRAPLYAEVAHWRIDEHRRGPSATARILAARLGVGTAVKPEPPAPAALAEAPR